MALLAYSIRDSRFHRDCTRTSSPDSQSCVVEYFCTSGGSTEHAVINAIDYGQGKSGKSVRRSSVDMIQIIIGVGEA